MIDINILRHFSPELRNIYQETEELVDKSNIAMTQNIFFLNLLLGYCNNRFTEYADLSNFLKTSVRNVINGGLEEFKDILETLKRGEIKDSPKWKDGDETTDPEFAIRFIKTAADISTILSDNKNYQIKVRDYFIVSCIEYFKDDYSTVIFKLLNKLDIFNKLVLPELKNIVLICKEKDFNSRSFDKSILSYLYTNISALSGGTISSNDIITPEMFVNAGKESIEVGVNQVVENSKTPNLDRYSNDLVKLIKESEDTDIVVGRDRETQQLVEYLSSRKKNSVLLVGPEGVGKTSIVENLARQIANGTVNSHLRSVKLVSTSLNVLQAGASLRGMLSERLLSIIREIKLLREEGTRVILSLDDLSSLSTEGGTDLFNLLKPFITNGDLTIIGCCNEKDFKLKIEDLVGDKFSIINIKEPTREETIEMINANILNYANHFRVNYDPEIVNFAVDCSIKYIHGPKHLPSKAIDVLNYAGAKAKLVGISKEEKLLARLKGQLSKIISKKVKSVKKGDFEKANNLVQERSSIESQIKNLELKLEQDTSNWTSITASTIADVVEDMTGIPSTNIVEPEIDKIYNLSSTLNSKVIGQNEAIKDIILAISKNLLGLRDPNRPIASFLFAGPTGIGKTLLCKEIAKSVFGSEEFILRIDGGEYSSESSVHSLLGAAPGYVGFDKQIAVFDKVRDMPYCIVLVDEFEKMHTSIINKVFLNILDEGYLNLSNRTKVDFKNTIIVFTSNLGSADVDKPDVGFGSQDTSEEWLKIKARTAVFDAVDKKLQPELKARISKIVIFNRLSSEDLNKIFDIEIEKFNKNSGKVIKVGDNLKQAIIEALTNSTSKYSKQGARGVRKLIEENICDPICREVVNQRVKSYNEVSIDVRSGRDFSGEYKTATIIKFI